MRNSPLLWIWSHTFAALLFCAGSALATAQPAAPPAFATEEQWIVDSVAHDILSYAAYISLGADAGAKAWAAPVLATKPDGPAFQLFWKLKPEAPEQTEHLEIPLCVWAPETYTAWAARLLSARPPAKPAGKSPPKAAAPSGLLEALLIPTATVQQQQNQRVSQWLAREPENPAAHEEAALVLTSLGLRESAGIWSDRRRTISRVTAHLALASALRGAGGGRTDAGRVAEAWLYLTLQRSDDTMKRIAELRTSPARAVQSWVNALEMTYTEDWRRGKDPVHASLLEQEVFVEELAYNTTVARALSYFTSQPKLVEVPDCFRTCLNRDFRIAAGHILTSRAVAMEMGEIGTLSGGRRNPADLVAWLNLPPGLPVEAGEGGHPGVRVIDPGMWARYSQRHLLYIISQLAHFYWMVGAPDARKDLRQTTDPMVNELTLGSTLRRLLVNDQPDYQAEMRQVGVLSREHPEWIGPALWDSLSSAPNRPVQLERYLADSDAWFNPPVPRGCAQSSGARAKLPNAKNLPYLEAVHTLNPFEHSLVLELMKLRKEDAAAAAKTAGPLNDYSLPVMKALAELQRNTPPAYRQQMEKICQIDPAAYMRLGRYLAEHLLNEEAAATYEKGIAAAPDPVDMSNECQWLVNWYFEKGRKKEAVELAQRALATGSSKGIWTEAYLDEQMGDLPKAFAALKRILDTYGIDSYVISFCGRHRNEPAHPEYQAIYQDGLLKHFPKSAQAVTPEYFTEVPKTACVFEGALPRSLIEAGLHPNDYVVAVDGQLCTSTKNYVFLRDASPGPTFEVIVRQNRKFVKKTVKAKPPLLTDYDL